MNRTTPLLLFVCLAAATQAPALAQNNDISILAGAFTSRTVDVSPSRTRISLGDAVAGEISYSRRFFERGPAALDLELPFIASAHVKARHGGESVTVSKALGAFTPGVRFSPVAKSRISPFALAGIGPGWLDSFRVEHGDVIHLQANRGAAPVFTFGGGVNFRVVRHFGFRGQVRDLVVLNDLGKDRRHRLLWEFGLSFPW